MQCLYVGIDGLDVAWRGVARQATIDLLEAAKSQAIGQDHAEKIMIGELEVSVAQTGAKGGYAFKVDTGDDGEIWWIKRSQDAMHWNIRVSVKSLALAVYGYSAVKERLFERAEKMDIALYQESIGRIDFCSDWLMGEDFDLRPEAFVHHGSSRCAQHMVPDAGDGWQAVMAGRRYTSVTIGTMPGRQLIVYDKRREAVRKKKDHWFDIWGVNKADRPNVWRIEVRSGKVDLRDHWGIRTFEDLEAGFGDLVQDALRSIRYCDPSDRNPNPTRRRWSKWWLAAAQKFVDNYQRAGLWRAGTRTVTGGRQTLRAMYHRLIAGLVASLAAVDGCDAEAAGKMHHRVSAMMRDVILSDTGGWWHRVERARRRLRITEDVYYGGDVYG